MGATSFVGSMSQKEGVIRFYKQFFNNIKFWVQKSGTIGQLIYSVRLPHGGYLLRKICRSLRQSLSTCRIFIGKSTVLTILNIYAHDLEFNFTAKCLIYWPLVTIDMSVVLEFMKFI